MQAVSPMLDTCTRLLELTAAIAALVQMLQQAASW